MAYLTQAEFLDQTIPGDVFVGLQSATIDTALTWASTRADSYLRKRYQTPITNPGEDLKAAVGDIAAFRLSKRRGFRPGSGVNEMIVDAYKDAIDWLKDVRDGQCELAGAAIDQTPDVDEMGSLADSDTPNNWQITTRQPSSTDAESDGDDDDEWF